MEGKVLRHVMSCHVFNYMGYIHYYTLSKVVRQESGFFSLQLYSFTKLLTLRYIKHFNFHFH